LIVCFNLAPGAFIEIKNEHIFEDVNYDYINIIFHNCTFSTSVLLTFYNSTLEFTQCKSLPQISGNLGTILINHSFLSKFYQSSWINVIATEITIQNSTITNVRI
jgi:hypothetical protein